MSDSTYQRSESSTLSEFVKRRYDGSVPIMGGNLYTGLTELGAAAKGSAANSTILGAISNLFAAVDKHTAQVNNDRPPIQLVDKVPIVEKYDATDQELKDASELDPEKIQLLLDASLLKPQDVKTYTTLLASAQRNIQRKHQAMNLKQQLKHANKHGYIEASDAELMSDDAMHIGYACMRHLGLTMEHVSIALIVRALTHESAVAGRGTNQKLAMVGDVALKLQVVTVGMSVASLAPSAMSNEISHAQSNSEFKDIGVRGDLHKYAIVGEGVDPTAKKIMATIVEALFGACFMFGGTLAVNKLNDKLNVIGIEFRSPAVGDINLANDGMRWSYAEVGTRDETPAMGASPDEDSG